MTTKSQEGKLRDRTKTDQMTGGNARSDNEGPKVQNQTWPTNYWKHSATNFESHRGCHGDGVGSRSCEWRHAHLNLAASNRATNKLVRDACTIRWSRSGFRMWIYDQFLSASLYFSKRGAYWDRLCRDVVGRWLVVTRVHCGPTVHPRPIVTMEH